MRDVLPVEEKEIQETPQQNVRVSLIDLLEPEAIQNNSNKKEEKETETGNENENVEFEEGFEPGKKTPLSSIVDKEKVAGYVLKAVSFLREWIYPKIYVKLAFEDWEYADLQKSLHQEKEALQKNKTYEPNNWERKLRERQEKLLESKMKIPFTEEEKTELIKGLSEVVKDVNWLSILEKHGWIMLLLMYEGSRFYEVYELKSK